MYNRLSTEDAFIKYSIIESDKHGNILSKNARKKLLVKAKKREKQLAIEAQKQTYCAVSEGCTIRDSSEGKYGDLHLIQSQISSNEQYIQEYIDLATIALSNIPSNILFRARIHNVRSHGQMIFIIFRQQLTLVQGVCVSSNCSPQMRKFIQQVPVESIADITGKILKSSQHIKGTTKQKNFEIQISKFFVVSRAASLIPFSVHDLDVTDRNSKVKNLSAEQIQAEIVSIREKLESSSNILTTAELHQKLQEFENKKQKVTKFTNISNWQRLGNRVIDLRTCCNQALLRIKSAICMITRKFLYNIDFTEIHTPKIIPKPNEESTSFQVDYFHTTAYLSESSQRYHQMAICSDLNRTFEIGPNFRELWARTRCHLREFTSLHLEMALYEHYHELLDIVEDLLLYIFNTLEESYSSEIELVRQQFAFNDFTFRNSSPVRLDFVQSVDFLKEEGFDVLETGPLTAVNERMLGEIVKKKFGSDVFVLENLPSKICPFGTMQNPLKEGHSNYFQVYIRGQKFLSGGQRIHDFGELELQAQEHRIIPSVLEENYDWLQFGSIPHAGAHMSIERFILVLFNLQSIQQASTFSTLKTY